MAEIMSQNEIDSLLNALSSGEVDVEEIKNEEEEKKVVSYDFRSPKKLAKDQLKTLQIIHDNFCRGLNTFLAGYLRSYVHSEVLSVEELSYHEFSNSIANPSVLSIMDFNPLEGQIVMDLSPAVGFAFIDRILGGKGKLFDEKRIFTEIESSLIRKLIKQIMDLLVDPWANVIELSPKLDKIEYNSQFVQIISPNETVALITLAIKIGDVEGMMNICIPHIVIEPILGKLSTKFWFSKISKEITENEKDSLKRNLEKGKLKVSAILGKTEITVKEFIGLQVGDVIKLNNLTKDPIEITVGERNKYYGFPGTMKNKLAIKITEIYREGDENYGRNAFAR
ncbi:MAG: flagellar motor switch protein FliM [Clostridiales bacterium]|nr:flagellar motor switch protein FliM [Clostridiales bacterium]